MPEPTSITAGNSYAWTKCLSAYPAGEGWMLAYSILDQTNQYGIDGANVVASGDDFNVTLPAALSTSFAEGYYSIIGYVVKGTERITVFEGKLKVRPDFTSAHDRRSYWQKVLEACQALMLDRASSDILTSTIEGDSLTLMTPEQLLVLHDRAERELARLKDARRAKRGRRSAGTLGVRFN